MAAIAQQLHAGVAVADITPPIGYRMSGYFNERLSTSVLNPLHAKALVLRQGDTRAAMVFCDIIGLSPDVSRQARERAQRETGIPAENILLAATHTHTGPLYRDAFVKVGLVESHTAYLTLLVETGIFGLASMVALAWLFSENHRRFPFLLVIGAIGVSGSTVENDHLVSSAGAAASSTRHR